jgi:hypothetical protein
LLTSCLRTGGHHREEKATLVVETSLALYIDQSYPDSSLKSKKEQHGSSLITNIPQCDRLIRPLSPLMSTEYPKRDVSKNMAGQMCLPGYGAHRSQRRVDIDSISKQKD